MSNTTENQLPSPGPQAQHSRPKRGLLCDAKSHKGNTLFTVEKANVKIGQ